MTNWVIMPYIDNPQETEQALADVLAQSLPVEVLLVDNGSRTPMTVKDHRVWHWSHQPALLSLATLWNNALTAVWESGGEYALVVNNDVRLPHQLYTKLLEAQRFTGAWFVSASNQGDEATYNARIYEPMQMDEAFYASRGGPDFSCFLITKQCHRYFQFDEQFVPAYHEDNDYHRRLQLAGLGDKIFSLPIPYLHYGSGTLRNTPMVNERWNERFQACRDYYIQKWGGTPHHETFELPFNGRITSDAVVDPRVVYTGQGRPGFIGPWSGLFDGQAV